MTPWIEALNKLWMLGYEISLNEGRLKYAYQGKDSPLPDQIVPLIEVLKVRKEEIINDPYFLIDLTIREIDEVWRPGTLEWVKRARPRDWERMLTVEGKINRVALEENVDALREALRTYKELMVSMRDSKPEI